MVVMFASDTPQSDDEDKVTWIKCVIKLQNALWYKVKVFSSSISL